MRAENWKASNGTSRVRGNFDLMLDSGMIIRGCTLVDGRDGDFVSLPQRVQVAGSGTKTYHAMIDFDSKERRERFMKLAFDAAKALPGEKT